MIMQTHRGLSGIAEGACLECASRCFSMCLCHLTDVERSRITESTCSCGQCSPTSSYCPNLPNPELDSTTGDYSSESPRGTGIADDACPVCAPKGEYVCRCDQTNPHLSRSFTEASTLVAIS